MKTIKIIDALVLTKDGVQSKLRRSKVQQVHLRQGDLDGACAVYAAFTALIILGVVEYEDLISDSANIDKRTSIGRLRKELLETKGMHCDGNHFYQENENCLFKMLKSSFLKNIHIEHYDRKVEQHIKDHLEQNLPVLISYSSRNCAHALVAIGFETDSENKLTKIFCLDPYFESPQYTYWNAVIDLEKQEGTKYKYRVIDDSGMTNIKLDDILVISKK